MPTHFMTWAVIRPLAKLLFIATLPVLAFGLTLTTLGWYWHSMLGPLWFAGYQVAYLTTACLIFDATIWLLAYGKTRGRA